MAARLDAPVLGALESVAGAEQRWQVALAWRYQRSDRHFRGIHEEANRKEEGSEVVNVINLADLSVRYNFSSQNSVTVGLPFLIATRSLPVRGENREILRRSMIQAHGLGDITIVGHRLLWDPTKPTKGNLSLGLGLKLPTGADNVIDTRERFENGEFVKNVESVDQSIQPGDGGFGLVFDLSGYRELGSSRQYAAYVSGVYLINPAETNGVETFRRRESERIMSVADQYLLRTGLLASPTSWKGWSVGLGGRIEGVPVYDLVGGSKGFRRPGYAISLEPSLSWTKGPHSFTLSVPFAVKRNRQQSVPDKQDDTIGDAAFADWLVLVGYFRRF